jgi:hypothetical protein
MTFQEFFLKKKIDLEALQTDKPDLFSEFQAHYSLMGSKSFDHTKKYWFNNLRHSFPLSEDKENELKERFKPSEVLKSKSTIESIATPKETTPVIGFKPRFKAPEITNTEENKDILPTEISPSTTPKSAGFKPRFKAGATKSIEESEVVIEKEKQPIDNVEENISKPTGFKPRFKTAITKTEGVNLTIENPLNSIDKEDVKVEGKPKPLGFKPRT